MAKAPTRRKCRGGVASRAAAALTARIVLVTVACGVLVAEEVLPTSAPRESGASSARTRNVVLFIGDGMGINQLTLARFQKGSLAVAGMEHTGLSFTYSLKQFVTDSAASATALATGYRTGNGQVSVLPDGRRLRTVLEYAEERDKWTGIVATSRITHATPACMAAHVKDRGEEDEIAAQLARAGIEVILGGGWDKFLPRRRAQVRRPPAPGEGSAAAGRAVLAALARGGGATQLVAREGVGRDGEPYGTREDDRDLVEEMKEDGYRFIRTSTELMLAAETPARKLIGLFSPGPMPRAAEGRDPSLPAMSLAALKILSRSPEGFFLMIEGSQIDWGGHENNAHYAMNEATDFDNAIEVVLDYLDRRGIAEETLVVVTADHETGGLALNPHPHLPLGFEARWTTGYHTGAPVPVFSSGPGSKCFAGITDHRMIGRRLIEAVTGAPRKFPPLADED